MPHGFLDIAGTPSVKQAQRENGSADRWSNFSGDRTFDRFRESETAFIAARDSFYMATVSETGWPYVQHRGGPPGFIRVLDDKTLAVADFRGNTQYISVGNLKAGNRVALIMVDYPARRRLRSTPMSRSRASTTIRRWPPRWRRRLRGEAGTRHAVPPRRLRWNCAQHITPRFTEAEIAAALAPVRARMMELEAENKALRDKLAEREAAVL